MSMVASTSSSKKETPMMKQWRELKAQAGGSLLFFRLGDFFELFEEDAVTAAPVLGVALTARNQKGAKTEAPALCGVPVASIENYLKKVLDKGYSIALADQTEDPSASKGIVRREIVQWLTPGIRLLENNETPYYAAFLCGNLQAWTIVAADVSTGHLVLESGIGIEALQDLIDRLPILDLRSEPSSSWDLQTTYQEKNFLLNYAEAEKEALEALSVLSVQDLGCDTRKEVQVLGTLFQVLKKAHPQESLRYLRPRQQPDSVWLASNSRKHLDLFEPRGKSLFDFLDLCLSAMGRRDLKEKLATPTQCEEEIKRRQNNIAYFKNNPFVLSKFRSKLPGVYDIHRLLRKRRGAKGLVQISRSLKGAVEAAECLEEKTPLLKEIRNVTKEIRPLSDLLMKSIQSSEDKEMGWIKSGISAELDELRELQENTSALLSRLEEATRKDWGIPTVKIKFHQVFGYVFEVSKTQKDKVPETGKRIQTLANAERYKTDALEKLEEKVLSVESRMREAESAEVARLYIQIEKAYPQIMQFAEGLAEADCFQALAEISRRHQWTTPTLLKNETRLRVKSSTHPLSQGRFVPMSFELNQEDQQIILLSGPNMAGKSTLLRMAALLVILHQIGSDVPAESSELSLFDRIACRMGAMDNLTQGQSTFYVEMLEVSAMLQGATDCSLLLFDELGRGTSTYDGMSLAWAITEEVHRLKSLSMVATHYLELAELEKTLERLKNYHLGVKESKGRLLFTRKLNRGPASQSYGIQVAELARLPERILRRAEKRLNYFEKKRKRSAPLFEWIDPS